MSNSTPGQGRSCSLGFVIQTTLVLDMGITEIVLIGEHEAYFIWKTQFKQPRPNFCHLEMGEGLPQTRDLQADPSSIQLTCCLILERDG